jgi:hypothetical protein
VERPRKRAFFFVPIPGKFFEDFPRGREYIEIMSAPVSRSSAILVVAGGVAILLLGAFSRLDTGIAPTAALTYSLEDLAIEPAGEPELPSGLSPGLAEIIRMAQAHVDESVILAFIQNSNQTYSPTAGEILYLADLGLSQNVIAALVKQNVRAVPEIAASSGLAPVAASPVLPPNLPAQSAGVFYNALAPYGHWTQAPECGLCWQPTAETVNSDWRPYLDQGQWVYTDNGWYWQSGYSWGWAVFHYGRWSKNARLGWVWVPGNTWGPAWVSWRIALSYSGWAPLPPGVGLATAGLTVNNHLVAADSDLGLPAGWFAFVIEDNFLNRNLPSYALPPGQAAGIYSKSISVNNYSLVNNKVINLGPGRPAIVAGLDSDADAAAMDEIPARKIEPAADPPTASEYEAKAGEFPEVNAPALLRQHPVLHAEPAPALPAIHHHHHELEDFAGYSGFAGQRDREPFENHEFFHRDQNMGPFAQAPEPERPRTEMPAQTGSKPGK